MKRMVGMMTYDAFKGGHAPGHVRDAFESSAIETCLFQNCSLETDVTDYIDDWNGRRWTLRSLLGQLWNCTDIVPWEICCDLDLPSGSTYAQAMRDMKRRLEPVESRR